MSFLRFQALFLVATLLVLGQLAGVSHVGSTPAPPSLGGSASKVTVHPTSSAAQVGEFPSPSGSLTIDGIGWGPVVGVVPLNVTFQVFVSGGVPPYHFDYKFGDGSGVSGVNLTKWTKFYQSTGIFQWTIWVNDSANGSVHQSGQEVVEQYPVRVGNPIAAPTSVDVGQPVTFHVNVTGGSGNYSYNWTGLPPGCANKNLSTLTCTPSTPNVTKVYVVASDIYDLQGVSNQTGFSVYPAPYFIAIVASPGSIDVGQTTALEATVGGGSGGFSYAWSSLPSGCSAGDSSNLTCVPLAPGHYTVALRVSDSNGDGVFGNLTLAVSPALKVGNITTSTTRIDEGQSLDLTISPTGGSLPYHFQWLSIPPGCTSSDSSLLRCSPTTSGLFNVSVRVQDGNLDSQASKNLTIDVGPALGVSASPKNATISLGAVWTLAVLEAGGVGPYSLTYTGMPSGCPTPISLQSSCTPSQAGSYLVTIAVKDSVNGTASTSVGLVVNSPTQSDWFGGLSTLEWVGLGGVAAAGWVAVVLVLLGRRRRPSSSPTGRQNPD